MEKYLSAVREMYSQFKKKEAHPIKKYLSAVRKMYSRFKKKEACSLEMYVGRYVQVGDQKLEVIGYSKDNNWGDGRFLIVDGASLNGWSQTALNNQSDVVFKNCERYYYVDADNLID